MRVLARETVKSCARVRSRLYDINCFGFIFVKNLIFYAAIENKIFRGGGPDLYITVPRIIFSIHRPTIIIRYLFWSLIL